MRAHCDLAIFDIFCACLRHARADLYAAALLMHAWEQSRAEMHVQAPAGHSSLGLSKGMT